MRVVNAQDCKCTQDWFDPFHQQQTTSLKKINSDTTVVFSYFTPFVINHEIDYTSLVLEVTDENIDKIILIPGEGGHYNVVGLLQNGASIDSLVFNDDGIDGDAIANDNSFTSSNITCANHIVKKWDRTWRSIDEQLLHIIYKDGSFKELVYDFDSTVFFVVNKNDYPLPIINKNIIGVDIYHTNYVVQFINKKHNYKKNDQSIKSYFDYVGDKDFLVIKYLSHSGLWGGASYGAISNDVLGIGETVFDNSSLYYSKGKLKGIISLAPGTYDFYSMNHELNHHWNANSGLESLDLHGYGGHWDKIAKPSSAFGGFSNYNGVFTNIRNKSENEYYATEHILSNGKFYHNEDLIFNDLELYFMGLLQTSEVESFNTLINPIFLRNETNSTNDTMFCVYNADGLRKLSIDDIINTIGEREPNFNNSQKHFELGFIVIHPIPLNELEFAFMETFVKEYEKYESELDWGRPTFYKAVGGKGTVSTRLDGEINTSIHNEIYLPQDYELSHNYPNPFNPKTKISYRLPEAGKISLKIYDVLGSEVVTLFEGQQDAGYYEQTFNAENLASGTYIYRLSGDNVYLVRKMVLLK